MLMSLMGYLAGLTMSMEASTRLPGSDMGLDEATRLADTIVVAKLIDLGVGGGSRNFTGYPVAQFQVVDSLRGAAGRGETTRIGISIHDGVESNPENGREYICFVKTRDRKSILLKMVGNNPENLRIVEEKLKSP